MFLAHVLDFRPFLNPLYIYNATLSNFNENTATIVIDFIIFLIKSTCYNLSVLFNKKITFYYNKSLFHFVFNISTFVVQV